MISLIAVMIGVIEHFLEYQYKYYRLRREVPEAIDRFAKHFNQATNSQ